MNITKVTGDGSPAELIYFVEKQNGERLDANEAANLINKVDIQRAAIVLGYQIQGALAQRKSNFYLAKARRMNS